MDKLRDFLKSWPGRILLLLCLSPLALLGIESYFHASVDPNQVAKVGEYSINVDEYQNSLNTRRSELVKQGIDASLIKENVLKEQVLKGLIDRSLLLQQAGKLGMSVSDTAISKLLQQEAGFQDAQGKFSNELFANFLRMRGMTKDQLFADFRSQLSLNQLNSSIVNTAIYPMSAVNGLIDIQQESREVWLQRIPWQSYQDKVTVTEQDLEDYYLQHKDELKSIAMVDLDYIELLPEMMDIAAVDETQIQQQYELYKQENFVDMRQVSQILFTGDDAQAKATEIQSKIDSAKTFAEMAKTHSQDPTGADGGAIGRFDPAVFGNDAAKVTDALDGLKVGEVSQPITTSYGVQLFMVTADDSKEVASLEDVRDEMIAKAKTYAQQEVYETKIALINGLTTDGYSLQDIAEQEGFTVDSIKNYQKQQNTSKLSQPVVIEAAFDDILIQEQAASASIELPNKKLWVQPSNYRPVHTLSLDEAKQQVTQAVTKQKSIELAMEAAEKQADSIKQVTDIDKLNTEQPNKFAALGVVNRQSPLLTDAERSVAFSKTAPEDGVAVLAQKTDVGVSVIAVGKMTKTPQAQLSDAEKQQTAQIIRDNYGQNDMQDYLDFLKMTTEVTINEAAAIQK